MSSGHSLFLRIRSSFDRVLLCLLKLFDSAGAGALLYDHFMIILVFRQSVQAEHCQYIHVEVVDHEANVAQAAGSLDNLRLQLAPEDEVDEDLRDFFKRLQIDVFGAKAGDNDRVKTLLLNDLVQDFFTFREQ